MEAPQRKDGLRTWGCVLHRNEAVMLHRVMAIGSLIISFVLLRYAPNPFVWIFFLWFAFFVHGAVAGESTSVKIIYLNIGVVFLVLGAYEAHLWKAGMFQQHDEFPAGIVSRHPFLGYAPRPNTVASHRRTHGTEVDFDVTYSIDSTGLRVSPPYDKQEGKGVILFFGGSFTFGSGVNDEETMPYAAGIKTNGEYHVYNFGYRGYGAHQMLSALEHGMVDSIIDGPPGYAIYQAIADHVPRAAGLKSWGKHDPRYILSDNGKVTYAGSFDEKGGGVFQWFWSEAMKCHVADTIVQSYRNRHAYDQANVELFAAVVSASRDIIETRYKGCEFHLILWESGETGPDSIMEALERHGLRVHQIGDMLPERSKRRTEYKISEHDNHPSALAHDLIAEYVVNAIIRGE
jgi:hypothetical protein